MKLFTRLIALLLTFCLFCGVLASCANNEDEKESEKESGSVAETGSESLTESDSTPESGSEPETGSESESGSDEPDPVDPVQKLSSFMEAVNKLVSDARVEGVDNTASTLSILGSISATLFNSAVLDVKDFPIYSTEINPDAGLIGLIAGPFVGVLKTTTTYTVYSIDEGGMQEYVKDMSQEEYDSAEGIELRNREDIVIESNTESVEATDSAAVAAKNTLLEALFDLCTAVAEKSYEALSKAAEKLAALDLGDYSLSIGPGSVEERPIRIDSDSIEGISGVLNAIVETVNPDPEYVSEEMTLEQFVVMMLVMSEMIEAESEQATAIQSFIRGELRAFFCGEDYDTLTGINGLMQAFGLSFTVVDVLTLNLQAILDDEVVNGLLTKALGEAWNDTAKKTVLIVKKLIVDDLLPVLLSGEFAGFSDEQSKVIVADVVELLNVGNEDATEDGKKELTDLLFSLFVKREGTDDDWKKAVADAFACSGFDSEFDSENVITRVQEIVLALVNNDEEELNRMLDLILKDENSYAHIPFIGTAKAGNGANGTGNYDKTMTVANNAISYETVKTLVLEAKYRPHFVALSGDSAAENYCGYEYTNPQRNPTVEAQFQTVKHGEDKSLNFVSLYMIDLATGNLSMVGTPVEGATGLVADEWNTVKIVIDLESGTYDTYVNDGLYATNGFISNNNGDVGVRNVTIDANKLFIAKCNKNVGAYLAPELAEQGREYSYCDVDDILLYTYDESDTFFADVDFEGENPVISGSHEFKSVKTEELPVSIPETVTESIRGCAFALAGVISAWWEKEDVAEPAKALFGAIADLIDSGLVFGDVSEEVPLEGDVIDDEPLDGEDEPYEDGDEESAGINQIIATTVTPLASGFFRALADGSNAKDAFLKAALMVVGPYAQIAVAMAMEMLPESIQPVVQAIASDVLLPVFEDGSFAEVPAALLATAKELNASAESDVQKQITAVIALVAMLGMPEDSDYNELGKDLTVPGMTEIDFASTVAKIKNPDTYKDLITFTEVTSEEGENGKLVSWTISLNLDVELVKINGQLNLSILTVQGE